MTEQSQLLTCKICGKTGMAKLGFHLRKKHMMSMAEYQNWNAPTPENQTFEVAKEPEKQTIKIEEETEMQPWYKRFFLYLNKLIC